MNGVTDIERLAVADEAALGAMFGTTPGLARRLLTCPRATPAIGHLIHARIGPMPSAPGSTQAVLLAMDAPALIHLAARAGAVRHARALLRLVDGAALRALNAAFGSEPRDDALRLHAMVAEAPPPEGGEPLEVAIARDGTRCLRAWCGRQEAAVGSRVMLLLPLGTSPIGEEAVLGAGIVDALVASV